MNHALRIAIAEDEPDMREYLEKTLPLLGHQVVVSAKNGRELIEGCRKDRPDLIITDIKMPELDGIDAVVAIFKEAPVPSILVTGYQNPKLIERAEHDHILAYLLKPITEADLRPAIAIAMRRFEQFQELRKETADLRQALEDRKIIERAKGALMKRASVDEAEAFRRLQKLAMEKRSRLVEVARMVLAVEGLSEPPDSANSADR